MYTLFSPPYFLLIYIFHLLPPITPRVGYSYPWSPCPCGLLQMKHVSETLPGLHGDWGGFWRQFHRFDRHRPVGDHSYTDVSTPDSYFTQFPEVHEFRYRFESNCLCLTLPVSPVERHTATRSVGTDGRSSAPFPSRYRLVVVIQSLYLRAVVSLWCLHPLFLLWRPLSHDGTLLPSRDCIFH